MNITNEQPKISKQVIVMRKDLGMRKGKMIAQGAHATMGAVFLILSDEDPAPDSPQYSQRVHEAWRAWRDGAFTKICVGVDSEQELMMIHAEAHKAGLPVKLITDAGHTEFHGVPTKTCLAIGPAWAEDIDKITGKLSLL